MTKLMINLIILLTIGIIIGAGGQIFLKKGLNQIGEIDFKKTSILQTILKLLSNKFVFLGLSMSAIAAFLWMVVLSGNSLSFVYPIGTAMFCITVLLLSKYFLKETISFGGWLGTLLIIAGIITIFSSKQ